MRLPWQRAAPVAASSGTAASAPLQLPSRHAPVEVQMRDGTCLHARVAGQEGGELLVLLLVPLQTPVGQAQLREIVLEQTGPAGVIRIAGDGFTEDGELLRLANLRALDVLQRREYVRVRATCPVEVHIAGTSTPIESSSLDLSGGGMLLGGLDHLRVGDHLDFRLNTAPEAPPITGSGTVVRMESDGRRAIAFDSISEGNQRRLVRFLFECQREERRKGLAQEGSVGR
ncbi:MAG TPA: PilZ domain-containing protein [Solirubrobacteraceae bacterium]|nr:PilZ domain-containing protein [Solirubrobacteraceae bacterium]